MSSKQSNKTSRTEKSEPTTAGGLIALILPNATVFISSGCIMVIELVAGRLIARHLGSSIYTWTSVIGVVLAGIAVGNYIGGLIADRYPSRRTLALLFILSSGMAGLISVFDNIVATADILFSLPWSLHVAMHVALVFFLPAAMLGTISPVVAKMALDLGYRTGRTIGTVYAWGVVGSICGTFLTGFWLVAWFGTKATIWGVAGVLAVMGMYYAGLAARKTWMFVGVLGLTAVLANAPWGWAKSAGEALALRTPVGKNVIHSKETQYSYLEIVYVDRARDTRAFHLDKLVHSQIDMADHGNLFYGYERICSALTKRLVGDDPSPRTLTIGGGGYVFPRYLDDGWPAGHADVVEIDPAVTEAAMIAFGLPRDTRINSFHEDGRVFVDRLYREKRRGGSVTPYDLIFLDVFDDVTVPHQLATLGFAKMVRDLLASDGAYIVNSVDVYDQGYFLGSLVKTLREVFRYVYVFVEGASLEGKRSHQDTFVIVGTERPFNADRLGRDSHPPTRIITLTDENIAQLVNRPGTMVLTDDYAPVENLLAGVVRQHANRRAEIRRATKYFIAARALDKHGEWARAVDAYKKGLAHQPGSAGAHYSLATALYQLKRYDEALRHYDSVLRLNPANADAHYMTGNVHFIAKRYAQAEQAYTRYVNLKPDDAKARKLLEQVKQARRQAEGGG